MGLFNVFDLQATLKLDDDEYREGLGRAEEIAVAAGGAIGGAIGSTVGTMAKLTTKAVAALAKSAAGFVKQAVDAYADYEQLVGGVETLFGDAADTVMQDAAEAFEFAGISANNYMQTVTSFSASLLQSLGGDTEKAAELSKKALSDMSDNANKMGTDMSAIQRAYQGFAKQNYTMLDNLKLGYGGTKAEMERLIMDANKLAIEQGLVDESALKLVVDEKAVAKASEAVAKAEAEVSKKTTALQKAQLSYNAAVEKGGKNSTSAQKAALNLKTAQENLATSQEKLAEAQNSLTAAQEGYVSAFDMNSYADIIEAIHLVQTNMGITGTTALEASTTITGSVNAMKGAWQNLIVGMADDNADYGKLVDDFIETATTAADNLLPRIETALSGMGEIVKRLAPKISEALPTLITDVLPSIAEAGVTMFGALISNVDDIIKTIGDNLPTLVDGIVTAIKEEELIKKIVMAGLDFFVALIDDVPGIIDGIIEGLRQVVAGVVEWFGSEEAREKMKEAGKKLIIWLAEGIFIDNPIMEGFFKLFGGGDFYNKVHNALESLGKESGGTFAQNVLTGFSTHMDENGDLIASYSRPKNIIGEGELSKDWEGVGTEMADGLKKGWMDQSDKDRGDIIGKVQELILLTEDELGIHSPSRVFIGIGENMAKGLKQGFSGQVPDLKAELRRQVQSLVSAVRNEMQIKSPSKVFAKIGSFMAQGLGDGFVSRMTTENKRISASIAAEPQIGSRAIERLEHTPGGKTEITQNIYAYTMTPAEAFASAQTAAETAEFLGLAG